MPESIRRDSRHLRPDRAGATGVTDWHVHGRSSQLEHHRFDRVVHSRIMHRRASFLRGVPLRETDIRGLAGRSRREKPPSLGFSPGGAPGFFCAPRRFAPADGCRAVSGVPGPLVVSHAARPTRLIFVGLSDCLMEKRQASERRSIEDLFFAPFDFWASLPSAIRIPQLARATGSILPRALPLAGLWARVCAHDRARPRSNHQPPGPRRPHIHVRTTRPNPLMGFRLVRRLRTGTVAVPSAY